jgi:hypothetical protein
VSSLNRRGRERATLPRIASRWRDARASGCEGAEQGDDRSATPLKERAQSVSCNSAPLPLFRGSGRHIAGAAAFPPCALPAAGRLGAAFVRPSVSLARSPALISWPRLSGPRASGPVWVPRASLSPVRPISSPLWPASAPRAASSSPR